MTEALEPALPDAISQAAERVLKKAHDKQLMLVTAESCTGGLLASLLTDVQGYGHVFERGIVSYSEDAKCELLHIARDTVDHCGAVSETVARAMAEGALASAKGDIALSITGYAGPGGDDAEEGLVHFACARHGFPVSHREEHFGAQGRSGVRIAALGVALEMIEEMLEQ